jgi:predicted permease
MRDLLPSVVHAFRTLRKSPGFALSALAILALGIGANTAIFGVVNAVLLKPLPFPDPGSMVTVFHTPPQKAFPGFKRFAVSVGNGLDWRKQSDVFEAMAIYTGRGLRLGGGNRPQAVLTTLTEADFFNVIQVKPALGRAFTAEECEPGKDTVVVLSNGFAESQFGSAKDAIGKTLELGGRTYSVIGVMPRSFVLKSWFPASTQAWAPVAWADKDKTVRGNHNYLVAARLKPGVTLERAQSQMNVISERLARDYPEENTGWGALVTPLTDYLVGEVRPALLTLLGAVGFVLLIACANTANLVLARTIARRKELAIRAALGASASQVYRPVLLETTLLSLGGGLLGLFIAYYGQKLVINALAEQLPRATEVSIDGWVLGFTIVVSILTGLASGLIACWRLLRTDLNESLKQGLGKTDTVSGGGKTRSALVVAEVALSLVLLVGAGLMIRSLWALRGVDPGFQSAGVTTMTVPIPRAKGAVEPSPTAQPNEQRDKPRTRFYDEFLPKVKALPGVIAVAAVDSLPLQGGSQQPIVIEGRPAEVFALQPNVAVRRATPDYFNTLRIPIIAGRDFNLDDASGKQGVILISQTLARQYWPNENPIGKRLRISFEPDISQEVIGIVGDVKDRGLDSPDAVPMIYKPMLQTDDYPMSFVVRSSLDDAAIVPAITNVLHSLNPELPIRDVETLDHLVATTLAQHRFTMFLFVALAGLAFLLAAIGIYSVLAYSIRRRSQEISIRMALGAETRDVLRLVVIEGMKPTLLGVAIGAFGALALSGILSKLIFGVSATDPYTFAAVSALLAAVALIACVIPAYRATRVDPVTALRNE